MSPGGFNMLLGGLQTAGGLAGLLSMIGDHPGFVDVQPGLEASMEMSSDRLAAAQEREGMGFEPAQRASFFQRMEGQQERARHTARDMGGGNLARAISGALEGQRLRALSDFAVQDERVREGRRAEVDRNLDRFTRISGRKQNIHERRTQQKLQDFRSRQQSYGQAMQSGLMNMTEVASMRQALDMLQND